MYRYLPKKALVFYTPGKPGTVFKIAANHYVTDIQLLEAQEYLMQETSKPVIYIEDRRNKFRTKDGNRV